MKLEEYLSAIKNCPDEMVPCDGRPTHRLEFDFGVYDNYAIFLKADMQQVLDDLLGRELRLQYTPRGSEPDQKRHSEQFLQGEDAIYGFVENSFVVK